jgi:prolipoprotein diacylglyceryl transferase
VILASFPSPPFNSFDIGPLTIHIYGITMGLAVATAWMLTVRRYQRLGGDPAVAERAAFWAVVLGFTGARLAYVSTHWYRFEDDWLGVFRIWEGGIAMFGGLTAGALAAVWFVRRSGGSFPAFGDAVAVGLPAAQAIGRWGNYFNQELFGTPATVPWAVEIDAAHRPAEYAQAATFHPTFLYESLWSIGTVFALLWVERRFRLRRGSLLLCYLISYGTVRFLLELIRTDTTFRLLGLSRNGWVAMGVVLGATCWLILRESSAISHQSSASRDVPADD